MPKNSLILSFQSGIRILEIHLKFTQSSHVFDSDTLTMNLIYFIEFKNVLITIFLREATILSELLRRSMNAIHANEEVRKISTENKYNNDCNNNNNKNKNKYNNNEKSKRQSEKKHNRAKANLQRAQIHTTRQN